jgi:maltooligosyltrehalose trehalohydrolase
MDAQWSDDFHHALHAVLTGEHDGYYADYGRLADIASAFRRGFVYTGQHSAYRRNEHGAPLPPGVRADQLLGYLQDHDQVGNRARGERISALTAPGLLYVGAALVLTSPFTPMLFMGEEWGATTPWQYFTDHDTDSLASVVRDGRRQEFASFGWDPEQVPDPQDVATFNRSRLDWREPERSPHRELFEWYRSLIRLRRQWPDLRDGDFASVDVRYDEDARWMLVRRGRLVVACNFAAHPQQIHLDDAATSPRVLLSSDPASVAKNGQFELLPHSVVIGLG